MSSYDVYMRLEMLDSLPKSGSQRRRILDFISSLRERPATSGDYTEKDDKLRDQQVKIVGDYSVYYYPDDAVKTVMITSVRKADRADLQ